MTHQFQQTLNQASTRQQLVNLIADIDTEKRTLNQTIKQTNRQQTQSGQALSQQAAATLKDMKIRSNELIEERCEVQNKLAAQKKNQQVINKAATKKLAFCQAFVAAAEMALTEEQFIEIEIAAGGLVHS